MYWNDAALELATNLNSWIVTLDVLKLRIAYALSLIISWIVTLDVLKYEGLKAARRLAALNSNIRCIEIHL